MRHRDDEDRVLSPGEQLEGLPLLDGHVREMARAADPMTSKNAAALALCTIVWQRQQIVRALQYFWAAGATAKEIADFLNRDTLPAGWVWDSVKVSRRIHEVRDAGDAVSWDGKERLGVKWILVEREGCAVHVYARGGLAVGVPPDVIRKQQRLTAQEMTA